MTPKKLARYDLQYLRNSLRSVRASADDVLQSERRFIELMALIDRRRLYLRVGIKSLRGYLISLGFSRTQSQRLATEVRCMQTTVNFEEMDEKLRTLNKKHAPDYFSQLYKECLPQK